MGRSLAGSRGLAFAVGAIVSLSVCSRESGGLRELPAEIVRVKPAPKQLDQDSITVMSWNIQGNAFRSDPDHLKKIVETIREIGPDVVMLQEVHRHTRASGEQDQLEILTRTLDMNGCFGESLRVGPGGSYGNAILTGATIRESRAFLLPGRGEPRTILECTSAQGGVEITLMTTHLTAWDRANRRTRALQTAAIEALLDSRESPLLVVGGDFNTSLTSREMAWLAASTVVRPVITDYVVTHRATGRNYDHVLAGDGWRIDDGRVIRTGPSDHWPVVARLSIGSGGDPR